MNLNKLTAAGVVFAVSTEMVGIVLLVMEHKLSRSVLYNALHAAEATLFVPMAVAVFSMTWENIPERYMRPEVWKRSAVMALIGGIAFFPADLFIGNLFYKLMGRTQGPLIAAPFLVISTLMFSVVFMGLSPRGVEKKYPLLVGRLRLWSTMIIWPVLAILLWKDVAPQWVTKGVRYPLMAFMLAGTLSMLTGWWMTVVWKWRGLFISLGATLNWLGVILFFYGIIHRGQHWIIVGWLAHYCGVVLMLRTTLIGSERAIGDRLGEWFESKYEDVRKEDYPSRLAEWLSSVKNAIVDKLPEKLKRKKGPPSDKGS